MMKRIMLVVGARPNLMKAAAIMAAMSGDERFVTRLVHTGQHYDENMSKIFFVDLKLSQPDVYLGIGPGSALKQIARILLALEDEALAWKPDLVLVVGDVNSTVAAALVANKLSIPLAHVEAGLRSFDRAMPEEHNRILTDALSDYLFTPSRDANDNLFREGTPSDRIHLVGNVMVDTLLRFRDQAHEQKTWLRHGLRSQEYAVITLHRPSNVDGSESARQYVDLLEAVQRHLPIVFPVHPRTEASLNEYRLFTRLASLPNIVLTPPLGYLDFISLMMEARVVLTDSGGIQEETTMLGVPCLTLRENTERPITITQGTNRLVGTDPAEILCALEDVLQAGGKRADQVPELWDGKSAHRIVEIIARDNGHTAQ